MTLWSVQVDVDVPAAARAVRLAHTALHDSGYLMKTVLTETFAGPAVRPWTLHRQSGPMVTLLGYTSTSIEELTHRSAMALPALRAAVVGIYGHPVPPLQNGQVFRFLVRMCPTLHITKNDELPRRHGERDAFLVAVDRGESAIEREIVYRRFLSERLTGVRIDAARLSAFKLTTVARPDRGATAGASGLAKRTVPDATLEGTLTVLDPVLLVANLGKGVGRHKAYGRGYVRLEPARP